MSTELESYTEYGVYPWHMQIDGPKNPRPKDKPRNKCVFARWFSVWLFALLQLYETCTE